MIIIPILNVLLRRLRGYFQIGVDEVEIEDPAPPADPDIEDQPTPADVEAEPQEPSVSAAERRAQEAESRARQLQEELERERSTRAAVPRQPDQLFEHEESRLRDPNISDLERWQIQSNRTIREARNAAAQAQINAADTADRAAYQTAALDNPRMRKYAERVEKALVDLRSKGQNTSRQAIYLFLLGQDVDKSQSKPAARPAARPTLPESARGRPVSARSDVPARGGQSERDKRRARLEGVPI